MDWQTLFFSPNGRIGQKDFWLGFLILLGIGVVLKFIPIVGSIALLVSIYCWVCLYAKRLHDMGKTGWLTLIPYGAFFGALAVGIPIMGMGFIMAAAQGREPDMTAVGGAMLFGLLVCVAMLICLGFLLWIGLSKGEPGDNSYGKGPPRSLFDSPAAPAEPPPPATVA